ncbi:MAG: GNAT family N-acetyltransferase [Methylococcaceae bacterium]|nr:GNAT family N-acetyltransferase [Methylococcaceae bacterium]
MNERIRIEFAGPRDALHIAEMSRQYIEAGLGWSWRRERVLEAIRNPETVVIKAGVLSTFAGFAIMRFGWQEAHLDLIGVKPRFRRIGVGIALLSWLEESAATAGLPIVRLELRETNHDALKFYEQRGYKAVRRIRGYYSGRETAIELARDLGFDPSINRICE